MKMKKYPFKQVWIYMIILIFVIGIVLVFNSCHKDFGKDFEKEPIRGGITHIAVSPDKTQVLITVGCDSVYDYGGLWVSDISFSNWRRLWHASAKKRQGIRTPSWSPDGKNICFTYYERCGEAFSWPLAIVDVLEGTFVLLSRDGVGRFSSWSPTENIIASLAAYGEDYQKRIVLFDLDKDEERILLDDVALFNSWGWMPDGRRIIYSSEGIDKIMAIDIFTLEEEIILEGYVIGNPTISSDGKKFVFADRKDWPQRSYYIALLNSQGNWEATQIDYEDLMGFAENWSPDDTKLVMITMDRRLWIMDPITQTKEKILDIPRHGFISIDWLSDSEIIFSNRYTISTINIDGTGLKQVFSLGKFER